MTDYTTAQSEAIACLDEPLQIIACAGSGKTQVISQRIAAVLAQPGVAPRNVIAFTFTEVTTAELKDRVLSAVKAIERYFEVHGEEIPNAVHSEKQIQVHIAPGITVDGRIALIRKLETDELAIVDFKSSERAQVDDITRAQLHTYTVGYQELTGDSADLIEVLNLDEIGKTKPNGDWPLVTG